MGKLIVGYNDLLTKNPNLAKEWDYSKNTGLLPQDVSVGSKKKVWWKCRICNNVWEATINSRNSGAGCPICGRKKAIRNTLVTKLENGANSLFSKNPPFLCEWDYSRNLNLTPKDCTPSSSKKVWWICSKCGNSFYSSICGRYNEGKGCPVCAGTTVREGINDLATINPTIALEWNYEKNHNITPKSITANNSRKVWWKCQTCGFEWQAIVSDRNRGTGCPNCKKKYHTSLPEQILFWYLAQYFDDVQKQYKITIQSKPVEIDIFIPSLNLAIEYDGNRWHKDISNDLNKNAILGKNNIDIIRIREPKLPDLNDNCTVIIISKTDKQYLYMEDVLTCLSAYINHSYNLNWQPNINIFNHIATIKSSYITSKEEKSLACLYPELVPEWDLVENGNLSPAQITAHNDHKANWKCTVCGGKWKATINDRTSGHGCPYCAGLRVLEGKNDFATMHPELANQWDYSKNGSITPNMVAHRSRKSFWWICEKCGQSYKQRIADKSNNIGCPICNGKKIISGINDLATDNPELVKEWDYSKNENLLPEMVAPQSNKKVWWICKNCGHSWNAAIYSRNGNKRGCPICRISKKENKKTI